MLLEQAINQGGFQNFRDFHRWSIENPEEFWAQAWNHLGIVGEPGDRVSVGQGFEDKIWFPEAQLNIVDTLLAGEPDAEVLVGLGEDGSRNALTRRQLRAEVAKCAAALLASGVEIGDRVAAFTPNILETVVFALAALSIGAVVSTASGDFGPAALIDRFGQIEPKVLLASSDYNYAGKRYSLVDKVTEVVAQLPTVSTVVLVGRIEGYLSWSDWLAEHEGVDLNPRPLPFSHPGFILFSSGTTGKPKCIVHSAGGVLLKVLSEQRYHLNIEPSDPIMYATTCGWMMWNWLVMGLGSGAKVILLDGSPGYPGLERLWKIADTERLAFMGVSAALIETWRKSDLRPGDDYRLGSLRTLASTGSPLAKSGFEWVAESVSPEISVASIAGGTDLCGCLVLGVATEKVVPGEIQGPALGLNVTVVRSDGTEAEFGEEGELVCRTPFPSVPLKFWGDDGSKRHSAYFSRHEGIWSHGDFARRTEAGGFEILGRLDATLNVNGVRIGTAEIYRVVQAIPEIFEAVAVEQKNASGSRVVLFVVSASEISEDLAAEIRSRLRTQASPRHVPAVIARAPELPKTRSGKVTELAIADIVAGRSERDISSLANPESLSWFRDWHAQSL